jgi:hypothetical protein
MNDMQKVYDRLHTSYTLIVEKYLRIDEDNIDGALIRHSADYAFMGAVAAYAKQQNDEFELELIKYEFTLRETKAKELTARGTRATKDAVDTATMSDSELLQKRKVQIEYTYKYSLAKNILNSMEHQKDMLVQISSNRRSEMKLHT